MGYPQSMIGQQRWMVRRSGKVPISAHESRPFDYVPKPAERPDAWRLKWDNPTVWSSHKAAASYAERHGHEGLSYVLHPAGDMTKRERIICFDFDKCIDDSGNLDSAVSDVLDLLSSFTEYSRSRRGLHCFVRIEAEPFTNIRGAAIGACTVDVLCSAQVAVTGDEYDGPREVEFIPYEFLTKLPFFVHKPIVSHEVSSTWDTGGPEEIAPCNAYLVSVMEEWPTAVEGEHGTAKLFAAACRLLEHGVRGREAVALLRRMPADPPFSQKEITRALDCAYPHVLADGALDTKGPRFEFPLFEQPAEGRKYGFDPVPIQDLMARDLRLEYLVDRAFVGQGPLFIGGREKCFKTGVAADLLVSLATGEPFLQEFAVVERRRSVMFTAEIGLPSAQNLFKRIAEAKGLDASSLRGIDVVDSIPTFAIDKRTGQPANLSAIRGLRSYFQDHKPQVAVFDPLYFAMGGSSVGDMYEIGTVLKHISELCSENGIWAIFCHHARKGSKEDEARPMELHDLYGAGVGAYARQWMLLSHAEPFRHGRASLYVNMGGSATGDRGLWRLDINEGESDDILGRGWSVEMTADDQGMPSCISSATVIDAIRDNGGRAKTSDIKFLTGATNEAIIERILRELVKDGTLTIIPPNRVFEIREQE